MNRRLALVLFAAIVGSCRATESAPDQAAPQASKPPSFDQIMEVSRKLRLPSGLCLGWMNDGKRYLALEGDGAAGKRKLVVVDASSGVSAPLFDAAKLKSALLAVPGVTPADAESWSQQTSFEFSDAKDAVLLNEKSDLYLWRLDSERAVRLTDDPVEEEDASFSPDGKQIAFVRDYNLYVVDCEGGQARQLTSDGCKEHLVGKLDWVYQEEVYGRGNFRGFWWSPDSKKIAVLALDQKPVPEITITDHRGTHPKNEVWRYPKPGDPNPIATLSVIDVAGGTPQALDLSDYPETDRLIVRVGWSPDSSEVVFQVQNRIQTWLDLCAADPATGQKRRVLRDATQAWIEPVDGLTWLDDGRRFLWLSERDGYKHLYLYQRSGELVRRLTNGPWEVDNLEGCDQAKSLVYFMTDKDDVKGAQLYRLDLNGAAPERLTAAGGSHSVSLSPTCEYFYETWSSLAQPGVARLCAGDGTLVRELARVDPAPLAALGLSQPEFVKVTTRDGFEMEALMIKPSPFDPTRKYPVLCNTYAGPHSPTVRDGWGGFGTLYQQMLAAEGYLIWICDNRSASGKGLASAAGVYKNLGAQELADIEDGLDWLIAQGLADPQRIGIWGWSYGGYMTAYALTHSKRFKLGMAGAPVTDWRLYDSIYTERYMDLPQVNPAGYDQSSAIKAAASLSGRLLLIHGTIDENVHVQNTLQMAEALQKAGVQFDLMLYPGNRHGVGDAAQRKHLYAMISDYVRRYL